MNKTFAFLTHSINIRQVKSFWPFARLLPPSQLAAFLRKEPLKVIPLKRLTDRHGNRIEGMAFVAPVLPEEIQKQDEETIFHKIIETGQLAGQYGFRILGLGGYFAAVADRKSLLYKHMKIPVTTGSALTSWCVFEGAFKAARKNKVELKSATVTILSPANSIGLICARKFAESVDRIILSGESGEKLERMRQAIQAGTPVRVEIENDLTRAVQEALIIINADPLSLLFDLDRVRPGSIVCDVSIFESIREKAGKRPDITFIDSKIVNTPFNGYRHFLPEFPGQTVCPALAETMLLAFRQNFVNYSLGDNVHPDKLDYIADAASYHGFEAAIPGAEIR